MDIRSFFKPKRSFKAAAQEGQPLAADASSARDNQNSREVNEEPGQRIAPAASKKKSVSQPTKRRPSNDEQISPVSTENLPENEDTALSKSSNQKKSSVSKKSGTRTTSSNKKSAGRKKAPTKKGAAVRKKGAAVAKKSQNTTSRHRGNKYKRAKQIYNVDSSSEEELSEDSFESEEFARKKRSSACSRRTIQESDEEDHPTEKGPMRKQTMHEVVAKIKSKGFVSRKSSEQQQGEGLELVDPEQFFANAMTRKSKPKVSSCFDDDWQESYEKKTKSESVTGKEGSLQQVEAARTPVVSSPKTTETTSQPISHAAIDDNIESISLANRSPLSPSKVTEKEGSLQQVEAASTPVVSSPKTTETISQPVSNAAIDDNIESISLANRSPLSPSKVSASKIASSTAITASSPVSQSLPGGVEQAAESMAAEPQKKSVPKWLQSKAAPPNLGSKDIPSGPIDCLSGLTFVITGVLDSLEREDAEDLVKRHGGRVTKSVSGKTSYLVAGLDPGESKMKKAREKKVEVIDEDGLLNLIRAAAKSSPSKPTPSKPKSVTAKLPKPVSNYEPVHVATTTPKGSMWVDKYKPTKSSDLIGNNSCIAKLNAFLQHWPPDGSSPRAALLSGPPGIGKSSAASICAKAAGFSIVEMNASDARSKKLLSENVSTMTRNRSLYEFFSVQNSTRKQEAMDVCSGGERSVLIMDEVDGMSSGDRGGMTELIKLIKSTDVPIVCICNDRSSPKVRTLANYCEDLRFRRPTSLQIRNRIGAIVQQEGLNIDPAALDKLHDGCRGDIRQILNTLQMLRISSRHITFDAAKSSLENSHKDFDLGAFDVAPKLFRPVTPMESNWINDRSNLYFVDPQLLPLMVQESYLKCRPNLTAHESKLSSQQKELVVLDRIAAASLAISDGDLVSEKIHSSQSWALMPTHAVLSSVAPGFFIGGGLNSRVDFPSWLGKNSTSRKNKRIARELRMHMALRVTGDTTAVVLSYMPLLRQRLSNPLLHNGADGIPQVIELMDYYSLSREDFDSVLELGQTFLGQIKIPTKVKTAFTRAYNAQSHRMPVALGKKRKKEDRSVSVQVDDEVEQSDDDAALAKDDDFDEEDESNDLMIKKKKKASTRQSKTGTKRASSASSSKAKRRRV